MHNSSIHPDSCIHALHVMLLSQVLAVLIQSIAAFPVMFLAIISLSDAWKMKDEEGYAVAVFVAYFIIFIAIAIMPTGGEPPWFFDKFVRYEIEIVYPVLF